MNYALLAYILPVLILLFAGAKFAGAKGFFENNFTLGVSKSMQGVAIIGVMFHHLSQQTRGWSGMVKALSPFIEAGALFVGFFFFCSGYGLVKSLQTKKDYLGGFLPKRLSAVLVSFFLANLVFLAVYTLSGRHYTAADWLIYLAGLKLINPDDWYIITIVLFYIAFYLIFRFVKKEPIAYIAMFLFTALYIAACIVKGYSKGGGWVNGEWWFNTCLILFVGMLWARFEPQITSFLKRFYYPVLAAVAVGFYFLLTWSLKTFPRVSLIAKSGGSLAIPARAQELAVRFPVFLLFAIGAVLLTMKVKFGNPVLRLLGELCLEIYVIHRIFIIKLRGLIPNDFLYVWAVIAAAVAAAALLHFASGKLQKLLLRPKRAREQGAQA